MVKQQTAWISFINFTNELILSMFTIHKYSNVFYDEFKSSEMRQPNSTIGTMQCRFNTGFLTTGQDWFYVSWISMDENGQAYFNEINPQNFRTLIDFSERMVCFPNYCNPYESSQESSKSNLVFNIESTTGFKKHCLRNQDSTETNTIELCINNEIIFRSASGVSKSRYTTKEMNLRFRLNNNTSSQNNSKNFDSKNFDIYINQLLKSLLESNKTSSTCSICLNENVVDDAVRHSGVCRGIFHFDCYQSLMNMSNKQCPLCREKLDSCSTFKIADNSIICH